MNSLGMCDPVRFQGLTYGLRPVWLLAVSTDTGERRLRRKVSERRTCVD